MDAVTATMPRSFSSGQGSGTGSFSRMDEVRIRGWFDEYSEAFAARGRGESNDLQRFWSTTQCLFSSQPMMRHKP